MSVEAIRALPLWSDGDAIHVEPLSGGITNQNFTVTDSGRRFVVRQCADDGLLGISRANELHCAGYAARCGFAPEVVYAAPGVTVFAFADGEPLTPELLADDDRLARVGRAVRAVHDASAELPGPLQYFSPFQVALHYLDVAAGCGLALPGPGDALRREVLDLQAQVAPFTPAFCHNDLMPGNLLDAGDKVWLIDWEYAGVGHPCFDLAGLIHNCELDADRQSIVVDAYHAGAPDPWPRTLPVMRAMAALRESLWAVVQGSQSAIEFDYGAYRDDNYARYRTALQQLETTT